MPSYCYQNSLTIIVRLVFIQGGSGVGMAAAQLAKNLCKGVQVIVTAGSDEKLSVCKENGADFGINYKTDNFALEVMKFTNNKGTIII